MARFARRLRRELPTWVSEGLIEQRQAESLVDRYPIRDRSDLGLRIAAGFGAVLVGAGATLVVAANWGSSGASILSSPLKIAGVTALMAASFLGGYWLRYRRRFHRVGQALILVGSAFFLADLALVTQQYNIESNPATLFLLLFLSSVPLMYVLHSREYALVAPLALAVWLGLLMDDDASRLYALDEAMLFAIGAVGIGAAILAAGVAHRLTSWRTLGAPMEWLGALILLGAVFYLGFYRHDPPGEAAHASFVAILLVAPGLVFLLICALGLRTHMKRWDAAQLAASLSAAAAVLATLVWSLVAALRPPHADFFDEEELGFSTWTVGFWALDIWLLIALAWLGLAFDRTSLTVAAILGLGAFLLARYFDLFGGAGLRGVVFIAVGIVVLGAALAFEIRGRRPSRASRAA